MHDSWTPELEAALAEPFPDAAHKTKKQGGATITFVDVHNYVDRLNKLVGVNGWSMGDPLMLTAKVWHPENKKKEIEPFTNATIRLVMVVPITILGVTKWNAGDEIETVDIYGSVATNAYAQAFKRTCSLFGLGAYLYDKTWKPGAPKPQQGATKPAGAGQPKGAPKLPSGDYKGKALDDPSIPTPYLVVKAEDFERDATKARNKEDEKTEEKLIGWANKIRAEIARRARPSSGGAA